MALQKTVNSQRPWKLRVLDLQTSLDNSYLQDANAKWAWDFSKEKT